MAEQTNNTLSANPINIVEDDDKIYHATVDNYQDVIQQAIKENSDFQNAINKAEADYDAKMDEYNTKTLPEWVTKNLHGEWTLDQIKDLLKNYGGNLTYLRADKDGVSMDDSGMRKVTSSDMDAYQKYINSKGTRNGKAFNWHDEGYSEGTFYGKPGYIYSGVGVVYHLDEGSSMMFKNLFTDSTSGKKVDVKVTFDKVPNTTDGGNDFRFVSINRNYLNFATRLTVPTANGDQFSAHFDFYEAGTNKKITIKHLLMGMGDIDDDQKFSIKAPTDVHVLKGSRIAYKQEGEYQSFYDKNGELSDPTDLSNQIFMVLNNASDLYFKWGSTKTLTPNEDGSYLAQSDLPGRYVDFGTVALPFPDVPKPPTVHFHHNQIELDKPTIDYHLDSTKIPCISILFPLKIRLYFYFMFTIFSCFEYFIIYFYFTLGV